VVGIAVSTSIISIIELPTDADEYKARLYSIGLALDLQQNIMEHFNKKVVIGIGKKFEAISDIERSYREAVSALNFEVFNEEIRHFGDINVGEENSLQYPIQKEKMLIEKIKMFEIGTCRDLIDDVFCWIFDNLGTNVPLVKTYLVGLVILIIRAAIENYVSDESVQRFVNRNYYGEIYVINDINILKKWFENIVEEILIKVQDFHSNKLTGIVNKTKAYVSSNYNKDITLEKAAEVVLLSPQHFSKAFKKETGVNFIDYITEFRIERSKEMLNNTNLNVKEISYSVGYNDPNYFFKVFKKATNLTPGEFRLRCLS
jgi:two-component system, response regulator YesN